MKTTLTEIEAELIRLSNSDKYKLSQGVWAEKAQLQNIRKILGRCQAMTSNDVLDLIRVVSDSASLDSRLLRLAERLLSECKK